MYIFKNAWLSIKRNKGRNLLIGLIILAISCACAVTLAIKNSATTLIDSYANQYEVEASIGVDRNGLMQGMKPSDDESKKDMKNNFSNIESVTVDDVLEYGDSSYVSSYYYTNSVGLNSSNIEKASSDIGIGTTNDKRGNMPEMESADFTLVGYSSLDAMTDFILGTYTISEGSIDFDGNNCVINSELASYNDLSVGDTIKLVDPNDESVTIKLTITGIYSGNEEVDGMQMFSNSVNNIITSTDVIESILSEDDSLSNTVTPTFILTGSDVVESFSEELTTEGLSEYLTVTTNLDNVEDATKSISNLSTYATTFLIITLIIGAIVLLIINMINIRERKYEIGVLRTIGMKKSLLNCQFLIELFIVAIVAMVIGTGCGALMSVPTANKLLENEINSSQEQMQTINNNFGPGNEMGGNRDNGKPNMEKVNGVVKVDQITSINAVVDIKVVLELVAIGLSITIISCSSAMISIQRFSPLTILKERS